MLEFCTGMHKTCDGMTRRDFVRIGTLSLLGLTMADLFRLKAYGQAKDGHAKAVIQIWLSGGPSHLDTFDPKPEAPEDYRGPLKAIETNVSGIRISEWMPRLAKCADKYSLIRSMTHISPAHELATHIVITGNIPSGDLVFPSMGSVVAWAKGSPNELPPYIAIPRPCALVWRSRFPRRAIQTLFRPQRPQQSQLQSARVDTSVGRDDGTHHQPPQFAASVGQPRSAGGSVGFV
jgi:Protein of unknown function (DUF1501).